MVKSMAKKKEKLQLVLQFPKIYRFITEEIKKSKKSLKGLTTAYILGIATVLVVLSVLDLASNIKSFNQIKGHRQTLVSQVGYWQKVVEQQKGYRDGYFMLAVLEYQLKNFNKSEDYLSKVLSIDPNFEPAQDFQKILNKGE